MYTREELEAILDLLNHASPAPGKENLVRLLAMIEKTEKMIEEGVGGAGGENSEG